MLDSKSQYHFQYGRAITMETKFANMKWQL